MADVNEFSLTANFCADGKSVEFDIVIDEIVTKDSQREAPPF